MKWKSQYLDLNNTEETFPCTVCGNLFTNTLGGRDLLFEPRCDESLAAWQHEWIYCIWGVDPFSDFSVCEECMKGIEGSLSDEDADEWLEERIAEFCKSISRVPDNLMPMVRDHLTERRAFLYLDEPFLGKVLEQG